MALKTRMCNMCQFWFEGEPFEIEPDDGVQRWIRKPSCIRGYNPRFYQPNSPRDEFWGWKRRCADYFENAMENPFSTSDTQ